MPAPTTTHDAVLSTVQRALRELGAEDAEITPQTTFESLDVDSLDLAEVSQVVEEEHGVRLAGTDVAQLQTVGDAVELVVARAQER